MDFLSTSNWLFRNWRGVFFSKVDVERGRGMYRGVSGYDLGSGGWEMH